MRRHIYQSLKKWQLSKTRMPLLVRGARQIGKTYVIEMFAQTEFRHHLTINFELNPEYKRCFTELDPHKIIERLELQSKQTLTPGESLLFLDEIQECPEAIQALRYFKEKKPDLHVIGAGSLLEFTFNDADFQMPVGRIEFLYMYPETFQEFLRAVGHEKLVEHMAQTTLDTGIDPVAHHTLLEQLKLYFMLGGMPAVIDAYCQGESLQRCQAMQAFILNTYRNDFGKYASLANQQHCRRLFEKAPYNIAKHFKYTDIDPTIDNRSLKTALHLLIQAGLLRLVYDSQASGLPLSATRNEKKFKLLFLDIGLANFTMGLTADILLQDDFLNLNQGALSEQFVGQELIAIQADFNEATLYFWQKHQRNDAAEVDYVFQNHNHIIPIEVKSGTGGRLRSLHTFMDMHDSVFGLKISQDILRYEDKILSLPLYMISELRRLVGMVLR